MMLNHAVVNLPQWHERSPLLRFLTEVVGKEEKQADEEINNIRKDTQILT